MSLALLIARNCENIRHVEVRILSPPRSLTVENVHGDGDGLRVGGAAGVLAAVRRLDGGDEQRGGGARRGLRAAAAAAAGRAAVRRRRRQHGDPAARRRVVDGLEGKSGHLIYHRLFRL